MKNEIIEIIAHELCHVLKINAKVNSDITNPEEKVLMVSACINIAISHVIDDFISIANNKLAKGNFEESLDYAQAMLVIRAFQDSDIKAIVLMAEDILKSEAANIKKNKKNKKNK